MGPAGCRQVLVLWWLPGHPAGRQSHPLSASQPPDRCPAAGLPSGLRLGCVAGKGWQGPVGRWDMAVSLASGSARPLQPPDPGVYHATLCCCCPSRCGDHRVAFVEVPAAFDSGLSGQPVYRRRSLPCAEPDDVLSLGLASMLWTCPAGRCVSGTPQRPRCTHRGGHENLQASSSAWTPGR